MTWVPTRVFHCASKRPCSCWKKIVLPARSLPQPKEDFWYRKETSLSSQPPHLWGEMISLTPLQLPRVTGGLFCLVVFWVPPLRSTKTVRRYREQQHMGAEALLPNPCHPSCLPAGCTHRNRWSLQVTAPPDSQCAAKSKKAEINSV